MAPKRRRALAFTAAVAALVALNLHWMAQFSGLFRAIAVLGLEAGQWWDDGWTLTISLLACLAIAALPLIALGWRGRPRSALERRRALLAGVETLRFGARLWAVLLGLAGLATLGDGAWTWATERAPMRLAVDALATSAAAPARRSLELTDLDLRGPGQASVEGPSQRLFVCARPLEQATATPVRLVLEFRDARELRAQGPRATGLVLGRVPGALRWLFERRGITVASEAILFRVGAGPAAAFAGALPLGIALLGVAAFCFLLSTLRLPRAP